MQTQRFNLYHLTAYPRKVSDSIHQIFLPEIRYVAIDADTKTKFIHFDMVINTCKVNGLKKRSCKLTQPIQSLYNSASCSVHLLTNLQLPNSCNYRLANITQELWFELEEKNSWLFIFPTNTSLTLACNNDIQKQFIVGAGVIRIEPYCSVFTEKFK